MSHTGRKYSVASAAQLTSRPKKATSATAPRISGDHAPHAGRASGRLAAMTRPGGYASSASPKSEKMRTDFLPVWLISFFTNRDLGLAASWKLAGAALLPGALLLSLFIVAYDFGFCDLVQLCFAFGMHLMTGWIYLFVSPLFLNRALPADKKNPFLQK